MSLAPGYVHLSALSAGARFRTESGRVGTLLYANDLRARVRFDGTESHVTLSDGTEFGRPGRAVDIAPCTEVQAI